MRSLCVLSLAACLLGCESMERFKPHFAAPRMLANNGEKGAEADLAEAERVPVAAVSNDQPVNAAAGLDGRQVAAGGTTTLRLRCKTAPGWYIYAMDANDSSETATRIALELPPGVSQGADWSRPAAKSKDSPLGTLQTYAGDIEFSVPLQIAPTAAAGQMEIVGTLHYQACSDSSCRPPTSQRFTVPLSIVAN